MSNKKVNKHVVSSPIDMLWLGAAVVVLASFFVLYSSNLVQRKDVNPEVQGVNTVNDQLREDFQKIESSLNEL